MQKTTLIAIFSLFSSFSYAIDLQNKIYNSDKSYFETISSPDIINKKGASIYTTYSIQKYPIVYENEPLIDGLQSLNTSFIYGLSKDIEIGANVSYLQTLVNDNSFYESYSGMGDALLELKYNLFKNVSIIPQYIMSLNDGIDAAGTYSGGYGLKLSTALLRETKLPIYINYAFYNLPDNTLREIDQSSRVFASIGTVYSLNKVFDLGLEYFHDQASNHSPKEIMSHITFDNDKFLVRSGLGFGLSDEQENEYRFFITLGFNFDFSSENRKRKKVLKEEFLLREINSVDEKKMLSESSLKNEKDDMDDHAVLPFYTVKEVKKLEKKEEKSQEKKNEELVKDKKTDELIKKKFNRLKMAFSNLSYFVDLYKSKGLSKEKALTEFAWSLRVIDMRRDTLDDIKKNLKDKSKNYELLKEYSKMEEAEKFAKDYIKNNNKELKKLRNKLKNKVVKKEDNESSIKKIKTNKNIEKKKVAKKKDWKSLTKEEEKLKKEQEIAWEVSKTKTLLDLKKEGKYKEIKKVNKGLTSENNKEKPKIITKKEDSTKKVVIIKKKESVESSSKKKNIELDKKEDNISKVTETDIPSIISVVNKKESLLVNKKEDSKSLLNKINEKLKLKVKIENPYADFYKRYQEALVRMKQKRIKKENAKANEIIIESFKEKKLLKKKNIVKENENINLDKYKTISVESVEKVEDIQKAKEDFLNEFYDRSNYEDAVIYEEGEIEKSIGPRY